MLLCQGAGVLSAAAERLRAKAGARKRGQSIVKGRLGRILIVTTAKDESRQLWELLDGDYGLAAAGSGHEALRRLSERPAIDLALIAGSLPDKSDVELVREIRMKHSADRLPLIMLAEGCGPDEVSLAFESGADNCLTRPFTKAVLTARIEALLKLKRRFDEERTKYAELEAVDSRRLKILRMLSHDLRSPLSNISLAVGILRQATREDQDEAMYSLRVIRMMVDCMGEVIANHLDFLELSAGEMRLKQKPVCLRDVIVNVVSQLDFAAQMKDIRLCVSATDGIVMADGGRLVQALGNLVSNAIKYSPPGSDVKIYTLNRAGFGSIIVADQGPGIAPEDRSKLFREYGKASTRPTGGETRTGLGLWIVKNLVEAQGGVVGADFPASGGSRFWIGLRQAADLPGDGAIPPSAH